MVHPRLCRRRRDCGPGSVVNLGAMKARMCRGLHPAILYAERGLAVPEDPYAGIVTPRTNTKEGKKEARSS